MSSTTTILPAKKYPYRKLFELAFSYPWWRFPIETFLWKYAQHDLDCLCKFSDPGFSYPHFIEEEEKKTDKLLFLECFLYRDLGKLMMEVE